MKTEAPREFNPTMIRCVLKLSGLSISDIARSLPSTQRDDGHVAHATVAAVIDGRARSGRVETCISVLTGHPLHVLWPQWYAADGAKKKPPRRYTRMVDAFARLEALHPVSREVA